MMTIFHTKVSCPLYNYLSRKIAASVMSTRQSCHLSLCGDGLREEERVSSPERQQLTRKHSSQTAEQSPAAAHSDVIRKVAKLDNHLGDSSDSASCRRVDGSFNSCPSGHEVLVSRAEQLTEEYKR